MLRFVSTAVATLALATPAHALPSDPNGLLLLGRPSGWGGGCPQASAVLEEFNLAGIPVTVVDPAAWASENFDAYTMIFVEDCQDGPTFQAWNDRVGDLDTWVKSGGFLGVHATRACGGWSPIQADIPGGMPTRIEAYTNNGNVLVPDHPIVAGIGAVASGTSLSHDEYTNTGNANDTVLISSANTGNAVLFERKVGHGVIIYGGLTYSYGQSTCGATSPGGQSAGVVMRNEMIWGSEFPLCGDSDADDDTVGDLCDVCDGGDDTVDSDADAVPDDCDRCPNLAWPDDVDEDGICDDIDDSDADGIVDLHDLCPQTHDPDQTDRDGDGWGDACDDCPMSTIAGPRMLEWFIDADGDGQGIPGEPVVSCERPQGRADNTLDCDDANRYVRQGAPEVCDGIDNNCDGVVDFDGCTVDADDPGGEPVEAPPTGGCHTAPAAAGGLALLAVALFTRRRR